MPWIAAAASIGGSLIGSRSAGKAARQAADRAAETQIQAARIAAEEQRFRPVGISSRFGASQFQFGPEGRLIGASYESSPEIRALQNRLSALYGTSLGQAEEAQAAAEPLGAAGRRLFGLGEQYLAESPEAARQRVFGELQDIRRPEQMREEARLGAGVFGRGRAGLNIGGAGQPELFALARAREEQRARDFAQAEQAAQQRIGFGAGLFGTGAGMYGTGYQLQTQALSPFQTQFGISQLLEQAAQQPLDIGAQLGGRTATAGANVGRSLLEGGLGAARTQLQGSLVGPSLLAQSASKINYEDLFGRLMGSRPTPGVNVSGFGYPGGSPGMSAEQAADYFGGGSFYNQPVPAAPPPLFNAGSDFWG
jgi:hypothetical protein